MDRIPVLPCRVRAVFSWAAESPEDLGFIEGDYIDVLNTGDGDWWTGRLKRNKMIGTFPRNYVEYVDKDQKITLHPDVAAQLAIKQSLPKQSSHGKTTQDILADIGTEINDLSFCEKMPPLPLHNSRGSYYEQHGRGNDNQEDDELYDDQDAPPPPPPHLIMSNASSINSRPDVDCPYSNGHRTGIETATRKLGDEETTFITEKGEQTLLQPLGNSPVIDEVPFNPSLLVNKHREPASQANRTLSGRSQSFDLGPVTKTKGIVRKLLRGIIDNTELKRSSSMTELKKMDSRSDTSNRLEVPKLSSLKFWRQENDDVLTETDNGQQVANIAAQKVLLDPTWMDSAQDLYRAKTLSAHEINKRRRKLELEGASATDPFKLLERYGTDFHDYYLESFDHVDNPIMTMSTWPQLWTPAVLASSKIGRQFKDPIDRLRGIFMLCAVYITFVPSASGPDGSDTPAALSRTMQTKRATPFELAHVVYSMCQALNIECRVVRGHYRPADGTTSGIPHAWNAVNVEGEWRFMDASIASPTFPGAHEDEINTFYFLTPPTQMIFTHIPNEPSDQCLIPPLPTSAAVNLPIAAPGAFRDRVLFIDFWSGMTILQDLEPCEFTMSLPNKDLDIVAEVEASSNDSFNGSSSLSSSMRATPKTLALSQPYWQNGQRFFKVKAILPESCNKGSLRIYTIERTLEKRHNNMMVLAYILNLKHRGSNAPFQFISRFGHPRGLRQDIYITEPQCRLLKGGQNYKFVINTHPSRGVSSASGMLPARVAIQSPSGRITKLTCANQGDGSMSWKSQIRTLEVGCWRAVIGTDDGEGWAPFAEWYCS